MKKRLSISIWNSILIVSVVFAAFVLPLLPVEWLGIIFRLTYSLIYVSAIFALDKRSTPFLTLFFAALLLEWVSGLFNLDAVYIISRSANVLIFLVIVALLIRQIANSKEVTISVIFGSITGYLLLGLVYSIFISIIVKSDPASYSNMLNGNETQNSVYASTSLYYSFVTLASLGYGDIVPLKPLTRSLSTFMAVTGQFYIAIIVALLVGKFLSGKGGE